MNIQSDQELLLQAYGYLQRGNPEAAKLVLEEALAADLDNQEIMFTLRCVYFWMERIASLPEKASPFDRGDFLIQQWKAFLSFLLENGSWSEDLYPRSMYAVQKGVFSLALSNYEQLFNEYGNDVRAEVFSKAALCYKKLGEYETALNCLGSVNELVPADAAVCAEMADCYALCGDDRRGKVLFREAFFMEPQKIDVVFLDSKLICDLIAQTAAKGFKDKELLEWIPVYGVLFGVLNVKRELRAAEAGRLSQMIYAMENELRDSASNRRFLVPRLINHYFWLIDHYLMIKADRNKINEVLLKIKLLNDDVYKMYTT